MPLHALLDTTVDGYFPIVDDYGERASLLEGLILQDTNDDALRTSLSERFLLTREPAPSADAHRARARGAARAQPGGCRPLRVRGASVFQDAYDHGVRVTDEIDTLRDLVSNRRGREPRCRRQPAERGHNVLTAVATILLVMSVVTVFFGQNFATIIPDKSVAL